MIRVFQRSMHNRLGEEVESRELCRLDLAVIAPVTAVVIALGLYPQFVLDRTEEATVAKVRGGRGIADPTWRTRRSR